MMVVDNKFNIGQVVYLLTDEQNLKRVVTAFIIRHGHYITYELSCGLDISCHTESEISTEKTLHLG